MNDILNFLKTNNISITTAIAFLRMAGIGAAVLTMVCLARIVRLRFSLTIKEARELIQQQRLYEAMAAQIQAAPVQPQKEAPEPIEVASPIQTIKFDKITQTIPSEGIALLQRMQVSNLLDGNWVGLYTPTEGKES